MFLGRPCRCLPLQPQKRLFSQTALNRSKSVETDDDALPVEPTWSVTSLLEPARNATVTRISDEQLQRLFQLAQLQPPETEQEQQSLRRDLDQMSQFLAHLQDVEMENVEPLIQIWPENMGLKLRKDEKSTDEVEGRALLEKAQRKSGNYYMVQGQLPNE
ncbi:hypothetical protein VTP01DRAFT_2238 [Rhizomucor pusillus]|uniref:uncharacterized protein n=1 Tax=Rhizomucor pusillus TaxID=4840 RepID=UPI0037425FE6